MTNNEKKCEKRLRNVSMVTIMNKSLFRRKEKMADKRINIILRCKECKNENYITTKNKRLHPDRFSTKKYCPKCNKMTLHEEKK